MISHPLSVKKNNNFSGSAVEPIEFRRQTLNLDNYVLFKWGTIAGGGKAKLSGASRLWIGQVAFPATTSWRKGGENHQEQESNCFLPFPSFLFPKPAWWEISRGEGRIPQWCHQALAVTLAWLSHVLWLPPKMFGFSTHPTSPTPPKLKNLLVWEPGLRPDPPLCLLALHWEPILGRCQGQQPESTRNTKPLSLQKNPWMGVKQHKFGGLF